MRQATVLGLLLLIPITGALAEGAEAAMIVAPGSRVRVITTARPESKRLIGRLLTEDVSSLTLEVDGGQAGVRVPHSATAAPKVHRSRSQRGRRALKGALAGALIGGIAGYASGEDCPNGQLVCFPRGEMVAAGAALGASVGAVIGALASAKQGWVPAPTRGVSIGAAPVSVRGRGVGLSVGLAF